MNNAKKIICVFYLCICIFSSLTNCLLTDSEETNNNSKLKKPLVKSLNKDCTCEKNGIPKIRKTIRASDYEIQFPKGERIKCVECIIGSFEIMDGGCDYNYVVISFPKYFCQLLIWTERLGVGSPSWKKLITQVLSNTKRNKELKRSMTTT